MTIKDLKDWLNNIPEDLLEYDLVIRDIKEMEEGKIGQKDIPIISAFVDKTTKRLAMIDPESGQVILKIRENATKEAGENTIQGSDLSSETPTETPTEETK